MDSIIKVLENKPFFYTMQGANQREIEKAEIELQVNFAAEYRDYVETFGCVSYDGHELTGVCKVKRLNVIDVTIFERSQTTDIPENAYVIEQTNIDGIVIWQTESGEIYQTKPGKKAVLLSSSLREYIESM